MLTILKVSTHHLCQRIVINCLCLGSYIIHWHSQNCFRDSFWGLLHWHLNYRTSYSRNFVMRMCTLYLSEFQIRPEHPPAFAKCFDWCPDFLSFWITVNSGPLAYLAQNSGLHVWFLVQDEIFRSNHSFERRDCKGWFLLVLGVVLFGKMLRVFVLNVLYGVVFCVVCHCFFSFVEGRVFYSPG